MLSRRVACAAALVIVSACQDTSEVVSAPGRSTPAVKSSQSDLVAGIMVAVANVEELYAAVNNVANAGATIQLAPATYVLSANAPGGSPRPNGGRLELQRDMSLVGVPNDRSAVVIQTASLPVASFTISTGKTGTIRIGRGRNAVEWLTIVGNPLSVAGIKVDLIGTPLATQVRIAHVTSGDATHAFSTRGIDLTNTAAVMNGRRIDAEIVDNDFFGALEGLRLANLQNVRGAVINAAMSGNRSYENENGCVIESNASSLDAIHVRSSGDRFEHNGVGCVIGGALVGNAVATANSDTTTFDATGTKFIDNTGPIGIDAGGIVVLGAETPGRANSASNNMVALRLWGCTVSGNQNADIEAFGARSTAVPTGVSGTNNTAYIELHGVSKSVNVVATNSLPVDLAGTNTITVVR
jgi:hypothetical protein